MELQTILNQSIIVKCALLLVCQGHTLTEFGHQTLSAIKGLWVLLIDSACCINYDVFSHQRSTSCNINYKIHMKYLLFKRWNNWNLGQELILTHYSWSLNNKGLNCTFAVHLYADFFNKCYSSSLLGGEGSKDREKERSRKEGQGKYKKKGSRDKKHLPISFSISKYSELEYKHRGRNIYPCPFSWAGLPGISLWK